jgi:hypothetical protein
MYMPDLAQAAGDTCRLPRRAATETLSFLTIFFHRWSFLTFHSHRWSFSQNIRVVRAAARFGDRVNTVEWIPLSTVQGGHGLLRIGWIVAKTSHNGDIIASIMYSMYAKN